MKPNKSLAAALVAACKPANIHMERAKREGISYIEAKARNMNEQYGSVMKEGKFVFKQEPATSNKLMSGHLKPAYGRSHVTEAEVISWFNRGMDFQNLDPMIKGMYCSIRDFAPGAHIQFRYGKALQKTFGYTIPAAS